MIGGPGLADRVGGEFLAGLASYLGKVALWHLIFHSLYM